MSSSLLSVNRHESALIALNTLERSGVELPEGMKSEIEALHEQSKMDLMVNPGVEITDWDLAEPDRLILFRYFGRFSEGY